LPKRDISSLFGISQVPQTLFGAVETLSQTLPDVILELTVLSAPARSRGVIPEAHPLSNGVRLEWHEVKSETHFTRHSGEGRNPEEWRYWWVYSAYLRAIWVRLDISRFQWRG